jgi:hypothetical protein
LHVTEVRTIVRIRELRVPDRATRCPDSGAVCTATIG